MFDPSNPDDATGLHDDPINLHDGPISLPKETVNVFVWLARVVKAFWRAQPRITALAIGMPVLARFTGLAAFVLPLKVLLLAGSHGVPRYFSGIVDPDAKLFWMIALSIAAASFYLLTRYLRTLSDRLSEVGSVEVMKEANKLALFGEQALIGRRHFREIAALCANLIFVAIAFVVIAVISPLLFLCLAGMLALQYGFTAFMLANHTRASSNLGVRIRENGPDYLEQLNTIDFWFAFSVILAVLVVGGGNVLLAILSFILVRQLLSSLSKVVGSTMRLFNQKHLIDALTFPTHQWRPAEPRAGRSFHSLFEKETHLAKLEAELVGHFETPRPMTVHWKDSSIAGVSTFVLTFGSGSNRRYCQEQVFAPYQSYLIKNEEVLFNHIDRELLNAPAARHHFAHGPFQCRLYDYGSGVPISASVWNARLPELLEQVWSVEPPDELIRIFTASHVLLQDRLTSEFIRKLELAVDSDNQAATLRAFGVALPTIRAVLSEMPLYVFNRDMHRHNTAALSDGRMSILMWGSWSLEPIGVYLPGGFSEDQLSAVLAKVRQRRPEFSERLSYDHLRLAAACRQLGLRLAETRYEAALHTLPALVNNPVLESAEIRDAALAKKAKDHDAHVLP